MNDWMNNPLYGLLALLVLLLFIILIWVISLGRRLKKLRKQYVEVMGNTGVANIEEVVIGLKQEIAEHARHSRAVEAQLEQLERRQLEEKGRLGVIRYNAFSEQGSDLSFSIAIVNAAQDGVVVSSIHSRDSAYVYAKPLEGGQSAYPLTPEELQAIAKAK
ncbi:DUF4446 family protein [Paenibacillus algorifonticola]|uniref:DUF4446 family protein n=1 Tax=Paenibacillus algorifonticola TaxID=684063 RepID=UPI003D2C17CB